MKELHRPAFLWMPKAMLREAKSWRKQTIPHTKLKIKQNKMFSDTYTGDKTTKKNKRR